jgi:uncharacterized protein
MGTPTDSSAPPFVMAERLGPISREERIPSIDVLRGVAILAIITGNIYAFSMILAAYVNPMAYGDMTGLNYVYWFFVYVFIEQEFLEVFAMLFGAGLVMMTARGDAVGRGVAGMHYRRMALMLVLGLLHAHLLWYGDILYTYALCGMVVFLFRRNSPRLLVLLGGLGLLVPTAVDLLWHVVLPRFPEVQLQQFLDGFKPPPDAVAKEVAAYRGGWLEQAKYRNPTAILCETWQFATVASWRAGSMMCVGIALAKLDVFTARRSSKTYLLMAILGLVIGLPVVLYGVHANFAVDWDGMYSSNIGMLYNFWGSVPMIFFWIGLIMLACKHGLARGLQRRLAAVGQMALSNYLLQTIICTTLFYGHGLGLYGKLERTEQAMVVLAVWIFHLITSPLWLRYFHFGPIEWLWRAVTYLKLPPMRRRSTG